MKKTKLISIAIAIVTAAQLMLAPALTVSAAPADFNAVEEAVPNGNQLYKSNFDTDDLVGVNSAKNIEQIMTPTGGYMQISKIQTYSSGFSVSNPRRGFFGGTYKFTGYFRMMYEDEVTALRVNFYYYNGDKGVLFEQIKVYPTSDEWMKVELYLQFPENKLFKSINICGDGDKDFVQSYCIDNFSLVKVDSLPAGYVMPKSFGTPVTPEQAVKSQVDSRITYPKWNEEFESRYDVKGVIVNLDNTFLGSLASGGVTEKSLKEFVRGYEGSHVTDYMICVSAMCSVFPSALETWTDFVDKYNQKIENGQAVDYTSHGYAKNAYVYFMQKGIDYIDIMCDTFPTIGINPWISIRMNDLHDRGQKTSPLVSDFYHENPQYRRVQHGKYAASTDYYNPALCFEYEAVRERMLDYINEALSRYDCYGLELDWQREIWIWSNGGEYNGLEILNDFMREVDRIIGIYEKKYGHDIKLGIRCASDIETNYDFGFDILTWAAEGILDQVIPTGRYQTYDSNIPVKEWTSLLHPYGVVVAPCIEKYVDSANRTTHTLETYNGVAAAFLSQGADKIALYNAYLSANYPIFEENKITTTDEYIAGASRHWSIVSTIGSYEKLMTLNRRIVLTYNDTNMYWKKSDRQLPRTIESNETLVLRIPLGDVPSGATVTFKFSADGQNYTKHPTVYINSKLAGYIATGPCAGGYTDAKLLSYKVPESAHDDMYLVVEIIPQMKLTVDHAEVLIEVAD